MNAQTQTIERTAALPAVIEGTLPGLEAPEQTAAEVAETAATAAVLAALAEITEGLRTIVKDGRKLEGDVAAILVRAWKLCAPGNVKQFKQILSDCEAAVLRDEKVDKWADLGPEFRSYSTYKSHFAAYIGELKATAPDNVEPITLRRQVSRWYEQNRTSRAQGATSAKKPAKDKEAAPQVATGEKADDGTEMTMPIGMSRTNIRAKGPDGKWETIEVNFPVEIIGALARLNKQIGGALNDGMPVVKIVEALQVAHDLLGPDIKPRKK